MGAITAALLADSLQAGLTSWTDTGLHSLELAEDLLRGEPLPIDLTLRQAVPAAVGLADGPRPLLAEPEVSELIDVFQAWLYDGRLLEVADPGLSAAIELSRTDVSFASAIEADDTQMILNATIVGLVGGIGRVPAGSASSFCAVDGRRGRRYLARLTDRLLGVEREPTYDPRRRRGPREVMPGLWVSNIYGVDTFVEDHPDGLVLSLCDPEGRFDGHHNQITFHIDDTARPDANPSLHVVLDEVLHEIAEARQVGRPVLVHCRHGASRTGLVLRALLVDELGIDSEAALMEAVCLWPHVSEWNAAWHRATDERSRRRTKTP